MNNMLYFFLMICARSNCNRKINPAFFRLVDSNHWLFTLLKFVNEDVNERVGVAVAVIRNCFEF